MRLATNKKIVTPIPAPVQRQGRRRARHQPMAEHRHRAFSRHLDTATAGTTAIRQTTITNDEQGEYYSLNGQRVTNPPAGVYIKNGKQVIL